MSTNIHPFQPIRPAPQLLSSQRLREYRREATRLVGYHADVLEACETVQMHCLEDHHRYVLLDSIKGDVLEQLLWGLDLSGLEYCDECGEVVDLILGVSDPKDDAYLSPWVHMERCGGSDLDSFIDSVRSGCGCFFRLPGSKELYLGAMLEAARARIEEAAA
jgi:hypothetical protein